MRDKCGWGEEISSSEEKRKRQRRERKRNEEMKETDGFFLQSMVFQQSEFVGPRSKVHLRDEGYAQRGRDSSYFGLFSTLRAVWLCFLL